MIDKKNVHIMEVVYHNRENTTQHYDILIANHIAQMKRYFITYGNAVFAEAKRRIAREANATGEFGEVLAYGPEDVGNEVKQSPLWNKRRGGGYWTWKPDVILQTLNKAADGDIIVYVDSGCEIVSGREWKTYWRTLRKKDLILQGIYQVNRNWTRRTVIDAFQDLPVRWLDKCQFMATVIILKKSPFTVDFISKWRQLTIDHPEMVGDVPVSDRTREFPCFIENRHDQTVLSACAYSFLPPHAHTQHIHVQWEHVENISPFRSQVIRAMRNATGHPIPTKRKLKEMILRVGKDLLRKPYFVFFHGINL